MHYRTLTLLKTLTARFRLRGNYGTIVFIVMLNKNETLAFLLDFVVKSHSQ